MLFAALLILAAPDSETLKVQVGVEQTVMIEFPAEPTDVVLGIDKEAVSIETKQKFIFIKGLAESEGELFVVLACGDCISISARITEAKAVKTSYKVEGAPARSAEQREAVSESVRLLAALGNGKIPDGYRASKISSPETHEIAGLRMEPYGAVESKDLVAFVLKVENVTNGSIYLDLSKFSADGLIVTAASKTNLKPHESTRVFTVFKNER